MKANRWLLGWLLLSLLPLTIMGWLVFCVDPFFHYRAPKTEEYYYPLNNERSQNNGILKRFEYDALITGTSMTQNFRPSEMDQLFGVHAIKVPFALASLKEINDNIAVALENNPELKVVIRAVESSFLTQDKDKMTSINYPTYLYDKNPFNDINYLLNGDVIFNRVLPMIADRKRDGFVPGITPFDDYSTWQNPCGVNEATYDGIVIKEAGNPVHLTEDEKTTVKDNVQQNIIDLAIQYPQVVFNYYFPPFSAVWMQFRVDDGTLYKTIEAEKIAAEMMLQCPNIQMFFFDNKTDIITDMNNYSDSHHYAPWINSMILKWISENEGRLTEDNYETELSKALLFYTSFDYGTLAAQEDYEDDFYAAALLNRQLTGAEPTVLCEEEIGKGNLEVSQTDGYRYLSFYARRNNDSAEKRPNVIVKDDERNTLSQCEEYPADGQWHRYTLDLGRLKGTAHVTADGDNTVTFRCFILY